MSFININRLVLALSTLLFCVPALAQPAQTLPAKHPKIAFNSTTFDFGKGIAGHVVEAAFTFTNTGDARLDVMDVHPSCGCTVAGDWTRAVEPGKTGRIPLKLTLPYHGGQVVKNIQVRTNDPAQANIALTLQGDVWVPVEVEPLAASLGVLRQGEVKTATLKVTNRQNHPLQILSVKSDSPIFVPTLHETKPGQEFEISIVNAGEVEEGMNQGNIIIATSSHAEATITITANCYREPRVEVMPLQIALPDTIMTQDQHWMIHIAYHADGDLKISGLHVNASKVKLSLMVLRPGKEYQIDVLFKKGFDPAANGQAAVTFKTSDPKSPTKKVTIIGRKY